ncbi:MAG TPA: DUF4978 domain-containing protein [Arachnia sp.]|nr:DUF4978 domain-containing protein [Arachnia sp.]HMT85942.1 DUF4978 domain-containing protein [Arachnia sp.]
MKTPTRWRHLGAALTALTLAVTSLSAAPTASAAEPEEQRVISRVVQTAGGGSYLEVDGKPWSYSFVQNMGAWERMGHQEEFKENAGNPDPDYPTAHLPLSFTENMYEKTAHLNYKTISQALLWREIEVEPGVYDFTVLDAYVGWAKKYGMKIDLAWFGSACQGGSRIPTYSRANNGAGRTVDIGYQYTAPSWYVQDSSGNPLGTYYDISSGPGRVDYPLITTGANADDMKEQEYKVVEAIFAHLAQTDPDGTVISIQIQNEANAVPNFSTRYIEWIDYLGKAVKTSDYVVATRVNYMGTSYPVNTNNYQYIDFAGTDPYSTSVSRMKEILADGKQKSSMGHIAENSGSYANTTSLTTATLLAGGYYGIWQLSNWFCDGGGGHFNGPHALYSNRDLVGVADQEMYYEWALGQIPTMTPQAQDLQRYNEGLNKLTDVLAEAMASNKAGFNVDTNNPVANYQGTKRLGRYTLGFQTAEAAVAIAVADGRELYATSDTSSPATVFATQEPESASVGRFDEDGEWIVDESRSVTSRGDGTYAVVIEAGEALRLQMPIGEELTNLALTATATSTSVNASFPAANANDGDEWTGLKSANNPSFPQYVTLTWSDAQTFNVVDLVGIYAGGQNPTSWDIEVSQDGLGGWTKVGESGTVQWQTNDGTAERKSVTVPVQRDVKAVRLKITSANTTWGAYYLTEITVTDFREPLLDLVEVAEAAGPPEEYTTASWAALHTAIGDARGVLDAANPTRAEVDAQRTALSTALAQLEPASSLDVTVVAQTRCVAGKVALVGTVTNNTATNNTATGNEEVSVSVILASAFGSKTMTSLAPGKSISHAFSTRQSAIGAGEVSVIASATIDGRPVSVEVSGDYDGRSC